MNAFEARRMRRNSEGQAHVAHQNMWKLRGFAQITNRNVHVRENHKNSDETLMNNIPMKHVITGIKHKTYLSSTVFR